MDAFGLIRTLGALALVLAMLGGALWTVRRYDIKLPGRISTTRRKRVELVERLSVDAKRSLALIRRDGCEHLILIGPEGNAVIEAGIAPPPPPAQPPVFGDLVELPAARAARASSRRRRELGHSARWNRAAVRAALEA